MNTSPSATRRTLSTPRNRRTTGVLGSAALLGTIVAALSISTPAHAAETPIGVPDSALRACLNAALDQPADAEILPSQVSGPGMDLSAHCNDAGISSLEGIEFFTRLHFVDVSGNNIRDVTPLGALGRNLTREGRTLSDIHIERNHITDLSTLGDLVVRYYFFAEPQQATLPAVRPLTPVANPLVNQDGSVIIPVSTDPGFRYDPTSNTFTFASFGPKVLTWEAPLTPGSQTYTYSTSGTLNISVTDIRGGDTPTSSPTATATPSQTPTSSTPTGPVSAEPSVGATPGTPTIPGTATASASATSSPVTAGGATQNPALASTGLGLSVPLFGAAIALLLGLGAALSRRRPASGE
ncbi:hypothetical protein [Mycetocola sp. JXN-3]|uniref:hypothetical protein n=1 Tax=Mycetocola sp. JXN-3 TaxID=2116510 RepID=UPI00165CFC47|nr:hypothetical protein [Mycetocola sp. JXN-3]